MCSKRNTHIYKPRCGPMSRAMHNLQHYRGKDSEWRKSIKKTEREREEKKKRGRKEESGRKGKRFTSGSMAGMQGGRTRSLDLTHGRPEQRDPVGNCWLTCRQHSSSFIRNSQCVTWQQLPKKKKELLCQYIDIYWTFPFKRDVQKTCAVRWHLLIEWNPQKPATQYHLCNWKIHVLRYMHNDHRHKVH